MQGVDKEELLSAMEAIVKKLLEEQYKQLDENLSALVTKGYLGNLSNAVNSLSEENWTIKEEIKWLKEENASFRNKLDSYGDQTQRNNLEFKSQ